MKKTLYIKIDTIAQESKIYVKFSKNITLLENFLKDNHIDYEDHELEETPLGRGYVIRRD